MKLFDFFRKKTPEPQPVECTLSYRKLELQYPDNEFSIIPQPNEEAFDHWLHQIAYGTPIVMILGDRGQGKSALGFRLLENALALTAKNEQLRSAFVLNYPRPELLPPIIQNTPSVEATPNGSLLLVDEAGLEFDARSSMSAKNKTVSNLMKICRHKRISLIFITQYSSFTDKNIVGLVNLFFIKQCALLQARLERQAMRKIILEADRLFEAIRQIQGYSKTREYSYIYGLDLKTMVKIELPSFWSSEISEAWS